MSSERQRSAASGRRRSAMGEFIPEPGERPLSSYGQPTPSGFDYHPSTKTAMPTSPSYSIHSRPVPLTREVTPAPSKYSTRRESVWKQKTFTITRKGTTRPYDTREHAHITCSPGAGHYHRVKGDVGSFTKRSMSARHRDGLHVGYPNSLIQPVDTMGFATPGPSLERKTERCKSAKFARLTFKDNEELRKKKERDDDETDDISLNTGPGPAGYNLPTPMSSGKTIGQKLHIDHELHYPAPNSYTIPQTVGQAKSFGVKNDVVKDQQFPSPATYTIPRPSTAMYSLNYRPFPTTVEEGPSPAHYTRTNSALPKAPDYTCRDKCKPVFPDVLLYPEYTTVGTPGAGDYEYDHEFVDNSAPKYSHGLPLPVQPNTNPGPNKYHVRHESTEKRFPSYSITGRSSSNETSQQSKWPSPADYDVRQQRPSTAVSITPRRNKVMSSTGPSPNRYKFSDKITRHGHFHGHMASMKGRRSTVCYSGFPSSHLSRLSSLAT